MSSKEMDNLSQDKMVTKLTEYFANQIAKSTPQKTFNNLKVLLKLNPDDDLLKVVMNLENKNIVEKISKLLAHEIPVEGINASKAYYKKQLADIIANRLSDYGNDIRNEVNEIIFAQRGVKATKIMDDLMESYKDTLKSASTTMDDISGGVSHSIASDIVRNKGVTFFITSNMPDKITYNIQDIISHADDLKMTRGWYAFVDKTKKLIKNNSGAVTATGVTLAFAGWMAYKAKEEDPIYNGMNVEEFPFLSRSLTLDTDAKIACSLLKEDPRLAQIVVAANEATDISSEETRHDDSHSDGEPTESDKNKEIKLDFSV